MSEDLINVEVPNTGCIVVLRGSVVDENTLRTPCQFCKEKYHYYGYYEGCTTPTYRGTHCLNMPRGTEVLIHFNQ